MAVSPRVLGNLNPTLPRFHIAQRATRIHALLLYTPRICGALHNDLTGIPICVCMRDACIGPDSGIFCLGCYAGDSWNFGWFCNWLRTVRIPYSCSPQWDSRWSAYSPIWRYVAPSISIAMATFSVTWRPTWVMTPVSFRDLDVVVGQTILIRNLTEKEKEKRRKLILTLAETE